MNTKAINDIATAIVGRDRWITVSADDPRIASGELISVDDAQRLLASRLQRSFRRVERALNEAAQECAGKTRSQIAAIMRRKLDATPKPTL
jgi:hypothetical protein